MKTIGMIGGMSWESSLEYYRILNEAVKERLGGVHSAKCVLYSVDFAEIEALQKEGRWDEATQAMIEAAQRVESGGADFLIICTNTMHKMADEVQANIGVSDSTVLPFCGDSSVTTSAAVGAQPNKATRTTTKSTAYFFIVNLLKF